jgi:hypothetical protein
MRKFNTIILLGLVSSLFLTGMIGCSAGFKEPLPIDEVLETQLIQFIPENIPEETREGDCWCHSIAVPRSDTWRCAASNELFDPCFYIEEQDQMICGVSPITNTNGFILELTEPLPKTELYAEHVPVNAGWLVELADGTICERVTGASGFINEKDVSYYCAIDREKNEDVVILGELQPGKIWQAEKAILTYTENGITAKEIIPIAVRNIWK